MVGYRLNACQVKIIELRYYFGYDAKHLPATRRAFCLKVK